MEAWPSSGAIRFDHVIVTVADLIEHLAEEPRVPVWQHCRYSVGGADECDGIAPMAGADQEVQAGWDFGGGLGPEWFPARCGRRAAPW